MNSILLVDDDPDVLEALAELLTDRYRVLVASNGEMALKMLAREDVDLIVADLMMPIMDGETLLKTIRAAGRDTPVIIFSAVRDLAQRASELGATGFCPKPCSPQLVEDILSRVLAAPTDRSPRADDERTRGAEESSLGSHRKNLVRRDRHAY